MTKNMATPIDNLLRHMFSGQKERKNVNSHHTHKSYYKMAAAVTIELLLDMDTFKNKFVEVPSSNTIVRTYERIRQ